MKKKIVAVVMLCVFIITAFPLSASAATYYLKAFTYGAVNFRETPGGRIIDTPVSDLVYVDVYSTNKDYYAAWYEGKSGYISRTNVKLLEKNVYVLGDYSYYIGDTLTTARNGDVLKFYVDSDNNLLSKDMRRVLLPAGTGRIKAVFSTFTVYHAVEAKHDANVKLAAERAEAVIQPGQVYSCNKIMGYIGKETGYQLAPTYSGGKVVQGYGGGACEVSTTLYNAVLLASLKVDMRHPHGLPVKYVDWDKGRDATIDNGVDFRFTNNRDTPVYVNFKFGVDTFNGEKLQYLTAELSEVT